MKRVYYLIPCFLSTVFCFVILKLYGFQWSFITPKQTYSPIIHLATVVCGDRHEEASILIKSLVSFKGFSTFHHIHLIAEENATRRIQSEVQTWPKEAWMEFFVIQYYPLQYPKGVDHRKWKAMFRPCSTQRLFVPDILLNVDAAIYLDTDSVVLEPLSGLWSLLKNFNATQIAALAYENEAPWKSGYTVTTYGFPYYPPAGLNAGILLMNFTRMRRINWTTTIMDLERIYSPHIRYGDQDLINIYFSKSPDQLYLLPCNWNYRPFHCLYNNCKFATATGASVVHGCNLVFHTDQFPPFKKLYNLFRNYTFKVLSKATMTIMVDEMLSTAAKVPCSIATNTTSFQIKRQIERLHVRELHSHRP